MYKGYPSTFHPIIAHIWSIQDPANAATIASARPMVERLLGDRFAEETSGPATGPLRIDFARERIEGAIEILNRVRALGRQAGACPEFFQLIDDVTAAARTALALVPSQAKVATPNNDGTPAPAAWAMAELKPGRTAFDMLPDYLRDI